MRSIESSDDTLESTVNNASAYRFSEHSNDSQPLLASEGKPVRLRGLAHPGSDLQNDSEDMIRTRQDYLLSHQIRLS